MSQKLAQSSDQVTILVFKGNLAARTFQVSLRWISRLGLLATFVSLLALMSLVFATRYYLLVTHTEFPDLEDLENRVLDSTSLLKPEDRKSNDTVSTQPEAPLHPQSMNNSPVLKVFPGDLGEKLPDPNSLRFTIRKPSISWTEQNTLKVRFSLEYLKNDQGSQQGRILILARGPETLFTYPPGTLNPMNRAHLLSPEEGESFSVSRFREVKAEFGPVSSKKSLESIEIFIFSKESQILAYERIALEEAP